MNEGLTGLEWHVWVINVILILGELLGELNKN